MALPVRVKSVHTTPKKNTIRNAAKTPLPPANATTVMQTKLGRFVAVLCDVGYSVFELEELGGHVGVAVDLTHECARLASDDRLDRVRELVTHRVLERRAHLAHEVALAGVDQRALDSCEDVLHHADDRVVDQVRLGLRRALAVVLRMDPDDGVGDSRGQLAPGGGACHLADVVPLIRVRTTFARPDKCLPCLPSYKTRWERPW